jgi:hypothetical protein
MTLSGSGVAFNDMVNGASALTVNTAGGGSTIFGGAVGSGTELISLETNADGDTQINGGSVETSGAQTYNDAATLGAGATTLSGSGIEFKNTVNGASALTVNTTGATNFGSAVGGATNLTSLTTNAGGTTLLNGEVTTTGDQIYNDAVTVAAGKTLLAGNNLTIGDGQKLTGEGALIVEATGGTATFGGLVETAGTLDVTGTAIVAKDNITATAGDILLDGQTTVAAGKTLTAGANLQSGAGTKLIAQGDLTLVATAGGVSEEAGDDGKTQIIMAVDDMILTLNQNDSIEMAGFSVNNSEDTDLVANSTGGSVSALAGDDNPADQWKSITATADGDVTLQGFGDITTNALVSSNGNIEVESTGGNLIVKEAVTASNGGVSLIADAGQVFTTGDTLNVAITGYSDDDGSVRAGVDLVGGPQSEKAAIVIRSGQQLNLGSDAVLTANGNYNVPDDRDSVEFRSAGPDSGDPMDVAIYLNSVDSSVHVDSSQIDIASAGTGTLVVDAWEKVTFGGNFDQRYLQTASSTVERIEVVSRMTQTLEEARIFDRFPYVDDPDQVLTLWHNFAFGPESAYVLRGGGGSVLSSTGASVLGLSNPAPLVPPKPYEPEEREEVEGPDIEELIRWAQEEGIPLRPYLVDAYEPSLNTSVRLYKAAERLREYSTGLTDTADVQVALLQQVILRHLQTPVTADEQLASFAQAITQLRSDPQRYVSSGVAWLDALTGYVQTLNTQIGYPVDMSVDFVMVKYGDRLADNAQDFVAAYLDFARATSG